MSMNKMFKKVLAVVAAGAMTMGMAMPTFAADGGKTTEAWITKTYYTEVGKAEKFSFTAEQVKTGTGIITTDAAVTMPEISFTDTETGTISKRGQITFPTYPEAGKYEYTVTETQTADPIVANSEHEKMIMSQAEYTMDVYVTDGATGTEISNIVVNKVKDDAGQTATGKVDIGNTDTNRFNFTNTYVQEAGTGTDPTNPDPIYNQFGSLNVSKKIVNANGTATTPDDEFAFTATFAFPKGTDANTLGGIKANGGDVTLAEGGTYTFHLKANKNMKFTGVPVGTTITVKESATKNYKGSAEITINGIKLTLLLKHHTTENLQQ
ncbi:MAG: Spy0128 family protein [Blautia obeum]